MSLKDAVLVVEDEALVRIDLVKTWQGAGYQTFEAASAAEAIGILEHHSEIRVVFTDIQMPGTMDGLEFGPLRPRALAPDHHRNHLGQNCTKG